jgi:hypothetical protein
MGPISSEWIKANGDHWAGGRIDISGGKDPYPDAAALPIMHIEDYRRFSNWLTEFKSKRKLNFEALRETYELNNPKLRLWMEEINHD